MLAFKQEGTIVVVLTPEELNKASDEFDDLTTIRDEFDPENGPRATTLASLIDAACKVVED